MSSSHSVMANPAARALKSDPFESTGVPSSLKASSVRGGMVTVLAQGIKLVCTLASTMVLARLLAPADFGLVAMATAVTGILLIFKDGGLSMATIQREHVTMAQVSNLFWVNLSLGFFLALLCAALALPLAAFYREPRLIWVTVVLSAMFLLGAAKTQHEALLRRQLRFQALAVVEILSMIAGIVTGIGLAWLGCGYWALVGMVLANSLVGVLGIFVALPWRPALPQRNSGVRSMLGFGGLVTGSDVLSYLFRNADNVLIGWYWGPTLLGFYTKAYGLLMLPLKQVNTPIAGVAISTLSRLQRNPERMRRYFLGGYSIQASITLPLVVGLAIFAEDIIALVLGPQWRQAIPLFQWLAPAAAVGALLNPLGWLFLATGRPDRQVRFGVWWCILLVSAFAAGLPYGPVGVAAAYSAMSCLLALPLCAYAIRGTAVRLGDLWRAVRAPFAAVSLAAVVAMLFRSAIPVEWSGVVRGIGGCLVVALTYGVILLWVLRQWSVYRELLAQIVPGWFSDRTIKRPV